MRAMGRAVSVGVRRSLPLAVALVLVACAGDAVGDEPPSAPPVERILAAARDDGFAGQWLEGLCDGVGSRLTGSPGMTAAVDYATRTLRDAGFDRVWTEPVTVPRWVRGHEAARVTAPVAWELDILGLGGSVGTPPGGIEAPVLVVSDFAELEARASAARGAIVLFDPPWEGYGKAVQYRAHGAVRAARVGAVAVLVRSAASASLATPHTGIMDYDEKVPEIPAASVTVEDASRIHRLARRGVNVRVHLEMQAQTVGQVEQANVLAELEGRELPDEIVLAGAHLDSWDVGTGAHDDGAGCAVMVGAVRLLHQLGLRPRRTVRVVLFIGEEQGGIGGDAYLAAHETELDRHVMAVESDSGCFAPDGFSVQAGQPVVDRLTALARALAPVGADSIRPGGSGVDIGPIVEKGVPGVGDHTKNERYFEYHHSAADTFDKVAPADLAANVAAVAGLVWLVAEDPVSLRAVATSSEQ